MPNSRKKMYQSKVFYPYPTVICLIISLFASTYVSAQQKTDTAKFMVASAHPLATQAGMQMLRNGGNAFDAIAAASFMLAVTEPTMSGLGGRLQAIFRKGNGEIGGIDATTQAPSSYLPGKKEDDNGYRTVGVPGMVKGIVQLHSQHGKLPLKMVIQPALLAAKKGFPILKDESARLASVIKELRKYPSTRKLFITNDTVPLAGSVFKQPQLAKTILRIAKDNGNAFYTGPLAKSLTAQISDAGGFLTMNDMVNYKALDAKILKGSYRGYEIYALGMPSYGAIVIEMLQILEQADLSIKNEADFLEQHALAHKKAYDDRKFLRKQEDVLIDKSFAQKRWLDTISQSPISSEDARNGHTTHLVSSDDQGNMVSLTQSLGPVMGSKVASEDGFMLATTMGPYLSSVKAGERAASHIAPVIVLKDGIPVLALGAAGGGRIVPAIVQVISRFIDQHLSLELSLAAVRVFHMNDKIEIENHPNVYWKDPSTLSILKNRLVIKEIKQPAQFGRVHAIQRSANGEWIGAADPDWSGTAGYKLP